MATSNSLLGDVIGRCFHGRMDTSDVLLLVVGSGLLPILVRLVLRGISRAASYLSDCLDDRRDGS